MALPICCPPRTRLCACSYNVSSNCILNVAGYGTPANVRRGENMRVHVTTLPFDSAGRLPERRQVGGVCNRRPKGRVAARDFVLIFLGRRISPTFDLERRPEETGYAATCNASGQRRLNYGSRFPTIPSPSPGERGGRGRQRYRIRLSLPPSFYA